MSEAVPIVIDIGDDVDVVLLPAVLVEAVHAAAAEADRPHLRQLIALLFARLGEEAAMPAALAWLETTPEALTDFPESLRAALADGTFQPGSGPLPFSFSPG